MSTGRICRPIGGTVKQFRGVFTAYKVSWFPDIVYEEVPVEPANANVTYYGRYEFTLSSAAELRYGYALSIKRIPRTPMKLFELDTSYTAASR
jgi:hypothetical protein